ncbi:FUSC family protein [Alcaligenes endophyticus]|uniref:FUSC family protein n=1 Tax=Alcaligenes endophyticus TaxID=1929088 RepID=A0ABT8ELZ1_9BURK|nr:FUSC family protein [Alcaligenes endophyticus]MCX5591104.1 FUSC family protein [Alcaligenes endophyticus]MDN4122318.1 FUSC family protein [Alcaligenes endophyticus]
MSSTAKNSSLRTLLYAGREELLPFDGRFQIAWRVAAQCALAALVFMTYGIPLAPIGCYLLLFIVKRDSTETTLMAIGISILLSLVVGMMFFLIRWSIDYPILRMVVLVLGSFVFLFLGAASKLGPIGNIVALVVGFIMTIMSDVPFGEVATRALLYAWLMGLTPMAIVVLFNTFFGRSTPKLVQSTILERLHQVHAVLQGAEGPDSLESLLAEGNSELNKSLGFTKLLYLCSTKKRLFLHSATVYSYRLMLAVRNMPADIPDSLRQNVLAQCEQAIVAVENIAPQTPLDTASFQDSVWYLEVSNSLRAITQAQVEVAPPASKEGFMYPDAFTNPAYIYFALRTTAAAVICYCIYTALDWQDIHTAMITCYVVALGSTAETVHKLTLRIIGCLIGACLGIASIVFLMPYMTSIFSLMLLVFVGTLIAGWVAAGSERIAYAGVQIGLAFLMTVLQGFGPTMEISAATDRIIGILLGNTVSFLVFTLWWPTSVVVAARTNLIKVCTSLGILTEKAGKTGDPATEELAAAMEEIEKVRESLQMSLFEPRNVRASADEIAQLRGLLEHAEQLCRLLPFEFSRNNPAYRQAVEELPKWRQSLNSMST